MVVPYDGKITITSLKTYMNPAATRTLWKSGKCEYCKYVVEGHVRYGKERQIMRQRMKGHMKRMHKDAQVVYLKCPASPMCEYFCQDASSMKAHLGENHPRIKLRTPDHSYIADVLGNVCSRFRRIAGDRFF